MDIVYTFNHLFLPRHTNNYKAKVLHSSTLLFIVALLVLVHLSLRVAVPKVAILGYAAFISPQEVVELTNQKRLGEGVGMLTLSETLSEAARLKALDMLEKDYWAHVAPDGTQPWDFFKNVGYTYRFAGENLARDFSNPESTIEAWLASPSHRENMLSGKYTEIGVAVVEGDLNGEDTTLIVQLFGTRSTSAPSVPVVSAARSAPVLAQVPESLTENVPESMPAPVVQASRFDIMRAVTLGVVFVLVAVLAVDVVVIARRGVTRVGGRALAHFSFMAMVLIILIIVKSGEII